MGQLYYEDQSKQIIGCAFYVLNTLGHGFFEKTYENALCVKFDLENIPFYQQKQYSIIFEEREVGRYVPDLIVFDNFIVEIKTIDRITQHEKGQVLNYLKVTNLKVGLILNFKHAKLEWQRIVL
jgi:GxxExxY protein